MTNIKSKKLFFYVAGSVLLSSILTPLIALAAPSAPTNLDVTGDPSQPTLTWDAAEGEPSGVTWTEETAAAGWEERIEYAATTFQEKLWVLGGNTSGGNENDVWSSSDGITWTEVTADAPWATRNGHKAVVFDDKMWIIGGFDVWYTSDGTNWVQAASEPEYTQCGGSTCARGYTEALVFDDKLWMMGGSHGGTNENDVWYSEDGATWTEAISDAAWPIRRGHSAAVYDNKMWVMGGNGASGLLDDVWYSEDGVDWTQATADADFGQRGWHSVEVFDNKMWVIGGEIPGGNGLAEDVWYSTDGIDWTQAVSAAGFGERGYHASTIYNNKVWVMGGYHTIDWNTVNNVWSTPNLGVTDYKICWDTFEGGCANSETLSAEELQILALGPDQTNVASRSGFWSGLVASISNFFLPKASAQSSSLSYTFSAPLSPGSWYFSVFALNGAGTSSATALSASFSVADSSLPGVPNTGIEQRQEIIWLALAGAAAAVGLSYTRHARRKI